MKYTPEIIVAEDMSFSIPLYQRLFEWNKGHVEQLLNDLLKSFENSKEEDYFVGMLTSANGQLVDGQQRFTVIMLMACVLKKYYPEGWNSFLLANNRLRLNFISRESDYKYLERMAQMDFDHQEVLDRERLAHVNVKMHVAIGAIISFVESLEEGMRAGFAEYVYKHLCFFLSVLENYNPMDLNKHFERMNSSGKNLESHEILKVKLLSRLEGDISLYMQIWNKIADVDTPLIREREKENEEQIRSRKNAAVRARIDDIVINPSLINGIKSSRDSAERNPDSTVRQLAASPIKPNASKRFSNGSRSVLRFPQFLLLTLYYFLKKKGKQIQNLEKFFNASTLLDTFELHLPYEGQNADDAELREFFELLLHCRIIYDICFIRELEYGYSLDMNTTEGDNDTRELMMFESFLYVSSSNLTNYHWFEWLMDCVETCHGIPAAKDLLEQLMRKSDALHPLPKLEELNYSKDIRYWFWRLDFILWQKRKELFKDDEYSDYLSVAENYLFIRNRSIEHIAPQHPITDSKLQWDRANPSDDKIMNSFGNLVMISAGLNSSLSNAPYEEKMAHVKSYFRSVNGTIESLKLLMAYKQCPDSWNKDEIIKHGREMYALLREGVVLEGEEKSSKRVVKG